MSKKSAPKISVPAILLLFLLFLNVAFTLPAQEKKKKTFPPAKSYQVFPTQGQIKVNGILDEADWQRAEIIKLPYEWLPGDNIQAPVETHCLFMYSKTHLYIGFKCFDPEPKKIRAHLMDRDATDTLIQDDHISIMIDTFNDERRGFQFRVNPLGVQADANFSEMEGYEDFSWDAIWQSAGRIGETGYVIEIAIPFNQLRFPKSDKPLTWGINAERSYPRNVRHRMTSHKRLRTRNCIICQFNKITGFQGISPGKNLEFDPTLTVNRTDERTDFPTGEMDNGKFKFEPGITARWGITSNVILNATVNPDFSQVEADVAQLEMNTRFALRYPEKRPFFLEGADFFLTPFEAVFTRTIYDPLWGGKLTSKFGKNALGIFATQDRYNTLTFPSNQGSATTSTEENIFNSVMRYRRDIGRGSAIGILYTGRSGENYHNRLGGVDGFFRLSRSKTFNFQYLFSNTQYSLDIAQKYQQKKDSFNGGALYTNFSHQGRNLVYGITYEDRSPDFRADMGYIPRVDTRQFGAHVIPVLWGKRGGWFNRISFPIMASHTIDYDGNRTDQTIMLQATYGGPMQTSFNTSFLFMKELYLGTNYDINRVQSYFGIKPTGGLHFNVFGRFGDAIDYSNVRLATSFMMMPALEWGIGKHLNLNLNHVYEKLSGEGEKIYTANLSQARIVYNFNVRTFVRAILQYTHISRNTDMYVSPIDPLYKGLFTQFLFSYKINPQTVLFLGYSDNHMGFKGIDMARQNRTFFLKIGYALVY